MATDFLIVLAVAGSAALASPLGGYFATVIRPTSLILSIAVGLAAGVLLGTFAFELLPEALELLALLMVAVSFAAGFSVTYGLDLYVNRGSMSGPEADQHEAVERKRRRRRPRGTQVTVIAGATSAEELIEGLAIGVGAAIGSNVAIIVGLAIFIDNVSEALSIGELTISEGGENVRRRVLMWTSLVGASLFASAMLGWFALRNMPNPVLGGLLALGAGAMFYLTAADLIPEAESHQYEQSSAIAMAAGFLTIMVLSNLK